MEGFGRCPYHREGPWQAIAPALVGCFQAFWRPKASAAPGRKVPSLHLLSREPASVRSVTCQKKGRRASLIRGVRHERTPYKRRLFGPCSPGRGGSNIWRNAALIVRGWRRRVLYIQQRQSADTFIFPIVKAFHVSQNSPTNQGGKCVVVPACADRLLRGYVSGGNGVYRWMALATVSSRRTMPNPAAVGRGRVVPQVESVLAQDAVTGLIVQDGLTEEGGVKWETALTGSWLFW